MITQMMILLIKLEGFIYKCYENSDVVDKSDGFIYKCDDNLDDDIVG